MNNAITTAAVLAAAAMTASAQFQQVDFVFDVTDSVDGEGSVLNASFTVDLNDLAGVASGNLVTISDVGWDVEILTNSPSWLSEVTFGIDQDNDGVAELFITPGVGDDFAGQDTYSSGGLLNLGDAGIADLVSADGFITIEIFESFDDFPGDVDGQIRGSLSFGATFIPAPAGAGALAMAGLVASRRRRA